MIKSLRGIYMSKYVIFTDSCLDLSKEQRERFQLEYPVAGDVTFPNGESKVSDVDWEEMSFEDFFHSMEKKAVYKSSLPNPFHISSRVEEYFKQGKDVLSITLSSGMSGTYNSFLTAKKEMEEKYPGRKMLVVDSRRYSGGIALLAIYASKNREKGMSIEENFKWLEENKKGLHQMGILDDLLYLSRSGRISKFKAIMGNFAKVKPMAEFDNENGVPAVLGNTRGYKLAWKHTVSYVKATVGDISGKTLIISHSIREQQALELKAELEKEFQDKSIEVLINKVGQSDGVNIGPGLVVVFYFGNPISANCLQEKAILTDIISKK